MEFDNSNGSTLDNLNQEMFQKFNALTEDNLDMDNKNTNITSPSIDNLNNIQSHTIDNQKTSEIIDQNRISHFDENNQHTQVRNITPFEINGKNTEFITTDNYFGPESNVDDDTVVAEFKSKNEIVEEIENNVNETRVDDLVAPHGMHFENINHLKTVDEGEECDTKKEDADVTDNRECSFDSEDLKSEQNTVSAEIPSDLPMDSPKLPCADFELPSDVPEKVEDSIENQLPTENALVPESGEESEDEWKYIEVKQGANENETQERIPSSQETEESQNICADLEIDNQCHDDEIARIEDLDMASQLNPNAKEFIPTTPSPTNITPSNSFEINSAMAALNINFDDEMVAQSPRKDTETTMANVPVPEEDDFLIEISKRPAEISAHKEEVRPGSSSSQCSYQEMNMKEAMHGDEKQEYAPDVLASPDQGIDEGSLNGDHQQFIDILNKSMRNQDPMSASFYNDGSNDSCNPFVDLNAVHDLPASDEEFDGEQIERAACLQTDLSGAKYSFEDTEFGMNDSPKVDTPEIESGANHKSESDNCEDIVVENVSDNSGDLAEPKANEVNTIVDTVQEMISENMAVLSECDLLGNDSLPESESKPAAEVDLVEPAVNELVDVAVDVSVDVAADNLLPTEENVSLEQPANDPFVVPPVDPLPVAENVPVTLPENVPVTLPENVPVTLPENVPVTLLENVPVTLPENAGNDQIADSDSLITVETNSLLKDNDVLGEEKVGNVDSNLIADQCLESEQHLNATVESESVIENKSETDVVVTEPVVETIVTAAAITAATAAAITAVTAATVETTSTKPEKSAEDKTKSSSVTEKKVTAVTASKPKAKPITQPSKTAPIPRPRTAVSQPAAKPIDKKPLPSAAPKKPLNGDVKTTTTATRKPITSTTTVKSTSVTTTTSSARLITKTSQTTTISDAAKKPKSATTVSLAPKIRPVLEKTTITKSQTSKVATSATDKLPNKPLSAGTRTTASLSPRTASVTSRTTSTTSTKPTSTTSQRSATVPAKKIEPAKIPSAPAPTKRPTSSIQEKRPPAANPTSKVQPIQKRPISAVNKNRTSAEVAKKSTSPLKKATKAPTTTTEKAKPQENGNATNGIDSHAVNDGPIEINNTNNDIAVNNEQQQEVIM